MTHTKSEELFRRAVEKIPGGVNSPVRAFRSVGGQPVFIARGEGSHLFDVDGNEYIDYVGSWGPLLLGHRHPEILAALEKALEIGTSFGAPTEQEIDLADAICEAVPSIEMVRLVNSGTEATMSAIRVARGFTGRDLIGEVRGLLSRSCGFAAGEGGVGPGDAGDRGHAGRAEGVRGYHDCPALQFAGGAGRGVSHARGADRGGDCGAGGGQHGVRASPARLSGRHARDHGAVRRAADFRRSDDGVPRGVRRGAGDGTASGRT